MPPARRRLAALLALASVAASLSAYEEPSAPREAPLAAPADGVELKLGRWAGSVDLGEGEEPMALRLFAGGALADFPSRSIFGYPVPYLSRTGWKLSFSFPGPGGDLSFEASPIAGARLARGYPRIGGRCASGGFSGSFWLEYSPLEEAGESYEVDTGRGRLPGTLLHPPADGNGLPVVLLVAGAGPLDRDGNNYQVPGRSDSLKALAQALAERGVASLRYDKRGAGEAYALVAREEELLFSDYVDDAVAAMRLLASDGRFSSVAVAGHGEGAIVAAAAMAQYFASGLAARRVMRYSLALLCPPPESPLESVRGALAGLGAAEAAEAARIMAALELGNSYPSPSPFFADFFRPSIQPYLASAFRYDLVKELARTRVPLLVAQGGRDPRAAPPKRILEARPDARTASFPEMGAALKDVGPGEDDAYAAFVDPALPLDRGLADLLAGFAFD